MSHRLGFQSKGRCSTCEKSKDFSHVGNYAEQEKEKIMLKVGITVTIKGIDNLACRVIDVSRVKKLLSDGRRREEDLYTLRSLGGIPVGRFTEKEFTYTFPLDRIVDKFNTQKDIEPELIEELAREYSGTQPPRAIHVLGQNSLNAAWFMAQAINQKGIA